ncbi:MAG TPA: hypothetical protein VF774_27605 [Pseudoduganella sp.]|jgi:5-keto 4-deoxyuronate isomerase
MLKKLSTGVAGMPWQAGRACGAFIRAMGGENLVYTGRNVPDIRQCISQFK